MVFPTSPLSSENVLRDIHDPAGQRIRVDAEVTAIIDTIVVNANGDAADGNSVLIVGTEDGTTTGTQHVAQINALGEVAITGAVTGVLNPSGLSNALKASRMTVTDTPMAIPGTALTGRNTMSVRLLGDKTIYFGGTTVTAAAGYPKFQYEEMVLDIQSNPSVDLWAVCATGETCEIAILEIG